MFKDNALSGVAMNDDRHRASENNMAVPSSGIAGAHGSPQIESPTGPSAAKVLRSFNTLAFKPRRPADPHVMLRFVSEAIALEAPIRFVLYWGKGPRCNL